ncbi:uncharacterized protein Z519_04519 [Cladophialophora bantiana CBS 173.52]|uniref:Uncharacterized protein n=1 Tax=Cladophialophora bantiana (strain ATCC 10958 / CBS 173.52 / CDC B-1940 / NIH 8579) TaxID=1442370 RepID=A0A0D2HMI9_CLAB1|nr:uncharacterized protein Z519_04519 [Cladophialophora bantiana CBS 173.52]KIW94543.1 hypothetical protein Z519_04519 [Cladophialophora bantiana CBS 173.52]
MDGYINGLVEFANEYPFATPYLWAAVLVDRPYLISDWYCWVTLGTEAWMTRQRVDDNAADVAAHRSGIKEE